MHRSVECALRHDSGPRNAPETFGAIVGIGVLAVILDLVWKWWRDRRGTLTPDPGAVGGG
jgi:hypothetical protein